MLYKCIKCGVLDGIRVQNGKNEDVELGEFIEEDEKIMRKSMIPSQLLVKL